MQQKQYFTADSLKGLVRVEIEKKPWPVKTILGKKGIRMTACVYTDGHGVFGESICSPEDEFDFRTGAKLALERALNVTVLVRCQRFKVVHARTRVAIWREFNRLLPPKK